MAGKMILPSNDTASMHWYMYKRQTTDDFSRVGVSGTRGIHCKSVTRIYICRRKAIVDR